MPRCALTRQTARRCAKQSAAAIDVMMSSKRLHGMALQLMHCSDAKEGTAWTCTPLKTHVLVLCLKCILSLSRVGGGRHQFEPKQLHEMHLSSLTCLHCCVHSRTDRHLASACQLLCCQIILHCATLLLPLRRTGRRTGRSDSGLMHPCSCTDMTEHCKRDAAAGAVSCLPTDGWPGRQAGQLAPRCHTQGSC